MEGSSSQQTRVNSLCRRDGVKEERESLERALPSSRGDETKGG